MAEGAASHPGSGGDSHVTSPCDRSTSVIPPSFSAASFHRTVNVFFLGS